MVKNLCYYYHYDGRKRMIEKQLPGADPVYMVYDKRDRLALTQDGNMRPNKEWLFTKYDVFNRPVMTGIYTNTTSLTREQVQSVVETFYSNSSNNTTRRQAQQYSATQTNRSPALPQNPCSPSRTTMATSS